MDKLKKHLTEKWLQIEAEEGLSILIPSALVDEADAIMPDTWADSVVSSNPVKGGQVVGFKREKADEFLQALVHTIDLAMGDKGTPAKDLDSWQRSARTKAKSWLKIILTGYREIRAKNPDLELPMTLRYLRMLT
jgi:hypothetical protein